MKKNKFALYLGSIAGTELYVHWTFLLLALWVFVSGYNMQGAWNEGLLGLGFLLAVFACITLHEFGHILVASRYGCPTRNITLYPIGGVASLERIPERPYEEFWMAAAGPFVSVAISGFLFLVISISSGVPAFHMLEELTRSNFLYNLMVVNLGLALFNLIPAFPMDGGRMFRSLLAIRFDRVKATRIAARTGYALALAGIIAGVFVNWWLVVIGFVVITGARVELFMEFNRAVMSNHTVSDVMIRNYTLLRPDDTLNMAASILLNDRERNFVIRDEEGNYTTLSFADVLRGLKTFDGSTHIMHVMHSKVPVFETGTSLVEAFQQMIGGNCRICPVLENGQLIGVLEMDNINEFVALQLARKEKPVVSTAGTLPA